LKLTCDAPLSSTAFNLNVRRYNEVHDVDEINFSFKAKFTVYFTWTDIGMWKGLTDFAG